MAKIKDIGMLETEAAVKAKNGIPTLPVTGDMVRRYNDAVDQIKKAEEVKNQLAPELLEMGTEFVFERNCSEDKTISSVKLQDQQDGSVLFTWQKRAKAFDAKAVEAFFEGMTTKAGKPANVNDYIVCTPVASFDTGAFMLADAKTGKLKFSRSRFDAFNEAMQIVADNFNIPNPLACAKAYSIQPDFNERRWTEFSARQNEMIQEVLPMVTSLKPIRSNEANDD